MEAIKKKASIKNSTLFISGLDSINDKEVEVIILPIENQEKEAKEGPGYSLRGKLIKYENPFEPALDEKNWVVLG